MPCLFYRGSSVFFLDDERAILNGGTMEDIMDIYSYLKNDHLQVAALMDALKERYKKKLAA